MNNQNIFRPFELLKLIRDRNIYNIRELIGIINNHEFRKYTRYLAQMTHRWESGLEKLGLIKMDSSGTITDTKPLSELFNSLNIKLSPLVDYTENSIVCLPLFGPPEDPAAKSDIFVIMPFAKGLKPVYDDHIRNAASKLGLTVARGDDFFTAKSIMSDIWNAINASQIVIADCTGRNPNVFYEIGMAHTLGKPVVLISQKEEDIPFDVRHIRFILYEFTPRGMDEFEMKLANTIKNELKAGFSYEMVLKKENPGYPYRL